MNPIFLFSHWNFLFEKVFSKHNCGAITTNTGDPLYVKYQNLADIGTLPLASRMSHQYLKLKDGDVVLTNDPYSGGTILSTMTLILAVEIIDHTKKKVQLLLSKRISFKPELNISESIEAEGVRIPPTPIIQANKQNSEILKMISQHPACPKNFETTLNKSIKELQDSGNILRTSITDLKLDFSKTLINQYFKYTQELFADELSYLPKDEMSGSFEFDHDCHVKLKINVSEEDIQFDFKGSKPSVAFSITDAATYGSCLGALISLFDCHIPITAGVYNCLNVIAPPNTIVHAKYPQPTYHGMTDGTSLIANICLQLISENKSKNKKDSTPAHGTTQCSLQIKFEDDLSFFDTLESGSGALLDNHGQHGLNIWKKSHLQPSIEKCEQMFPLKIKSCTVLSNSGGSGKFMGGHGLAKVYQVEKPATITWMLTQEKHNATGAAGGKHGSHSEIYVIKADSSKVELPAKGVYEVLPQDQIIIHSAGGGGYGEIEVVEEDA